HQQENSKARIRNYAEWMPYRALTNVWATDRAFAARRHTELNGLCLNAVPLGDSLNCHGFQAVVSVRKTPSEAACRRQDLSRVSHAPVVFLGRGTPRSASLHVGLNACHRLRRFGL